MSRLSQMLKNEQARRELTDYAVSKGIGVLQQTYSSWKHGSLPRPNKYAALAGWLGVSIDMVAELVDEAKVSTGNPPSVEAELPATIGRVSDRKEGRYKFDSVDGKRFPTSRYAVEVGTNVMEPALLYGTKIWLDPGIWPKVGNEVMVHARGGVAWLGKLLSMGDGKAEVENAAGRHAVENVDAVHVVVLAERVAA